MHKALLLGTENTILISLPSLGRKISEQKKIIQEIRYNCYYSDEDCIIGQAGPVVHCICSLYSRRIKPEDPVYWLAWATNRD